MNDYLAKGFIFYFNLNFYLTSKIYKKEKRIKMQTQSKNYVETMYILSEYVTIRRHFQDGG